ncbi:MAG TPA: hypothetical protein VGA61_17725 [Anaerolineae bacterium]
MSAGPVSTGSPAVPILQAPAGGVTVRMYRQGLGDCFLLAFPTADPAQSYYVMIDCGVVQNTPGGSDRLNDVAKHIKAATGNHIHLLVVTHRHWDHMAGFNRAGDVFGSIQIDNLWLPWLENLADPAAQQVWGKTGQALAALTAAIARAPTALSHVQDLLDNFFGETLGAAAATGAAASSPMANVIQLVKDPGKVGYRKPGEGPLALPATGGTGVPSVQVFVLGPPSDPKQLAQMDPSSGAGRETYLLQQGLEAQLAFSLGRLPMDNMSEEEGRLVDFSFPFDPHLQITRGEAENIKFFRQHYGFDDGAPASASPAGESAATTTAAGGAPASDAGSSPITGASGAPGPGKAVTETDVPTVADAPDWRRIDTDWTAGAEELALQIDNVINNTSLVLAFEFVKSHKVLFFAADAQVGNWLSWNGLTWKRPDGTTVSSADLLTATVLYKVGHHGSVNATVIKLADGTTPWGVGLMSSPDLVALLSADHVIGLEQSGVWHMPDDQVRDGLLKQTKGRVIRIDKGVPQPPAGGDPEVWQEFLRHIQPDPATIQPYPPGTPDPKYPQEGRRDAVTPQPLYIDFNVIE